LLIFYTRFVCVPFIMHW